MPILAEAGSSASECGVTMGVWGLCFIATLAGLFISLYLLISHDDLQSSFLEPMELANQLKTYMPVDFVCSGLFLLLTLWAAPLWTSLCVSLPLAAFNLRSFLRRDHKQYFITRKEY